MDAGWEKWLDNVFRSRVELRGRNVIVLLVLGDAANRHTVTLEAYEDVCGMIGGRLGTRKYHGTDVWGEAEYPGLAQEHRMDPLEVVGWDATGSMTTIMRLREL